MNSSCCWYTRDIQTGASQFPIVDSIRLYVIEGFGQIHANINQIIKLYPVAIISQIFREAPVNQSLHDKNTRLL